MKIIDPIEITKANVISTNAQDELLPAWQVEGVQFPQNFPGQTVDYRGDTIAYHNDRQVFVYSRAQNQSRLVAEVTGNAPNETLVLYDVNGIGDSEALNTGGVASEFRQVRLSPNELSVAFVLSSGVMVVMDLQNGAIDFNLGAVDTVEFSESGAYLATMGSRFRVINASTFVVEQQEFSTFATSAHIAFSSDETRCMAVGVSNINFSGSPYKLYTLEIANGNFQVEDLPIQATDLISRPGFNEVTVTYVNRVETRIPGTAGVDSFLPFITRGALAGIYSSDGQMLYLLGVSPKNQLVAADRVNETTQTVAVSSYDVGSASKWANLALSSGELALTDIDQGFQFILESTLSAPSGNVNPQFESGERTIFQNRIYEAQQATQTRPDVGALESAWLDLGPVNSLRMFDGKIGSVTETEGDLEVVLQVEGIADGLALFGLQAGSVQLEILDSSDAVVFDTGSLSLIDNSAATDWYQYFFEPISYRQEFSFTKLPPYRNARIRVTLSSAGVPVKVGALILGSVRRIGDSQFGAQTGIDSFSRKERDVFGNFDIIKRGFSKTANLPVSLPSAQIAYVQQLLASLESKPVVYIGAESQRQTIIYGFYASFDMVLSGPLYSDYNLEIEGLTQ
ncbi:hypothetical protein [Marinobacter sp. MCTG268]|uniref:hypothetical protein n=1 Tax=Marinobacter adhaerens TaxID=1033846 RepID=UPI00055EBE7C